MIEKVYIVPIQKKCNCNCKFCISKVRDYQHTPSTMRVNEKFFKQLDTLRELEIKKVEITGGGEPTLNNNIQSIIDNTRAYLPGCYIKLYTNGRLQIPINNIDEINISMADIDDDNNKKIMQYKDAKKTIDVIAFYRQYAPKLRLSLPIISGAIDNEGKMLHLIDETKKYIDEYVVRTLYEGTNNMASMYADFVTDDPRVIMEKDNCLCEFKNRLIMWSDNNLYNNWDLNEQYSLVKKRR